MSFFVSDFDTWMSIVALAVSYKRLLLQSLHETLERSLGLLDILSSWFICLSRAIYLNRPTQSNYMGF